MSIRRLCIHRFRERSLEINFIIHSLYIITHIFYKGMAICTLKMIWNILILIKIFITKTHELLLWTIYYKSILYNYFEHPYNIIIIQFIIIIL